MPLLSKTDVARLSINVLRDVMRQIPRIRLRLEGFECLTAAGWLIPKAKGAPQEDQRTLPRMPNTPARGLGIVAACGCGHAVGRSVGERSSGTVAHRQADVFGVKALFRLRAHKHHAPQPKTQTLPIPAP